MITYEGVVKRRYHEFRYDVELENGFIALCHRAATLRVEFEDIEVGDSVTVQIAMREHGPFHRIIEHRPARDGRAIGSKTQDN